jgi:hypothetical protein
MRIMIAVLIAGSLCLSGCFKVKVKSSRTYDQAYWAQIKKSKIQWHFFYGLTDAHVRTPCKNGMTYVETKFPWWSVVLVMPLTAGLVAATKTKYLCADANQKFAE